MSALRGSAKHQTSSSTMFAEYSDRGVVTTLIDKQEFAFVSTSQS